ncbi:tRNA pseudouridine synthase D-like protein [Leptospira interrogans str. 2006001854]|uniref:tRNA pseudouridine synthase D-like protein n=1 Tax=Leptospira interrogans str. 2006001854 TaxID=1001590 RepID=M6GFV6_LEPIR|nr:tRNA pseudouridine synthase D-like protein [Leptospira interrogans str. 2006001854]
MRVPKELTKVIQLDKIGFSKKSLSTELNIGNRFQLVLRNLLEKEIESIRNNFEKITKNGFINYYDSQRFSRFHSEFRLPILPFFKGDAETCLKLILTDPFPGEKKQARDRKKILYDLWGNWSQCEKWSKSKLEKNIFSNLKKKKTDTKNLFRFDSSISGRRIIDVSFFVSVFDLERICIRNFHFRQFYWSLD